MKSLIEKIENFKKMISDALEDLSKRLSGHKIPVKVTIAK